MILIYIHIGKVLIDYLIDSVFQTILIDNECTIYVLLSDELVEKFNGQLRNLKIKSKNVNVVKLSTIQLNDANYVGYINIVKQMNLERFRDSFWISTTCRFFYIHEFIKSLKESKNIFHIENDVMIYNSLEVEYVHKSIYMVKDSPSRVIPSIMCFCDVYASYNLTKHIYETLQKSGKFMNDMEILSSFPKLIQLNHRIDTGHDVYDGAAIGQYLGGIDYKNITNHDEMTELNNPTVGFINETCDFKIKTEIIKKYTEGLKKYTINDQGIVNLHIHSKQLFKFSSVFDIEYKDIITGDRVLTLVDYVVTTQDIFRFHNLSQAYLDIPIKMILLENVSELFKTPKSLKLFVYTHILDQFIEKLNDTTIDNEIVLYLHNSDHEFTELHYSQLSKIFKRLIVYAQNVNCEIHDNVNLLPIGIANSMWPHGSLLALYRTMKETYKYKKTKKIYINVNPKTYNYRYEVLKQISPKHLSRTSEFPEYLRALAKHEYSLCVRGNGIDTHRFWESLYLGTIPIIINNEHTKCDNFVKYLKRSGIPFEEVKEFNYDKTYSSKRIDQNVLKLSTYAN